MMIRVLRLRALCARFRDHCPALLNWNFRIHDRRDDSIHMIFVAQQAVLTRCAAGVTGLAEFFFYGAEIGREVFRISLLVALQIRTTVFHTVAGQTTATFQDAEMRFMDEIREASLFRLDLWRREIDYAASPDLVNATAFRA